MRKIESMMITAEQIDGSDLHELVLLIGDWDRDYFRVTGFDDVEEANDFGELLAQALGIPPDYVFSDVFDSKPDKPKLTRIK